MTVVVVGGGYGGITVAKALDAHTDVVLVEPREAFVHNVAALRGVVSADWADRIFLPYDQLLSGGEVVRDKAARVDGTTVTLGSGRRIDADYVVLASGSSYPFPAKVGESDVASAKERFAATRAALTDADRVLLVGAGAVGLELTGEIAAAWPDKRITLVDPSDDLMGGAFPDALRSELRRQLAELGVEVLLGTSLVEQPPVEPGEAKTFTVRTDSGGELTADLWFRCFGVVPSADYVTGSLASARLPGGGVAVTDELRVAGQERVFAIGDVTGTPEGKTAKAASAHADVVAANIRTLLAGGDQLTTYEIPKPAIVLPLGPTGGAGYAEEVGLLGAEDTSKLKGADLMVGRFAEALGIESAA